MIQDQPHLADETVENLAQVFRYVLRKSEDEWVRLEEEVEFVRAYLKVEQARFGSRLEMEFDVDPEVAGLQIPAMTIQPLVENAIRHGVGAIEGRGRVGLSIHLIEDGLMVEVRDNGPGFPVTPTHGHGLQNVMDRLRGYYGGDATLNWSRRDGSTIVVLQVAGAKVRLGRLAS